MIRYQLTHPDLLSALSESGHGSQILVADGNYPHNTGGPDTARRIRLNLRPGLLTVDQILDVLIDAIPIESAAVMVPQNGDLSPPARAYRETLGGEVPIKRLFRFDFYEAARNPNVSTLIASGDLRQYANLLITIGVRHVPES